MKSCYILIFHESFFIQYMMMMISSIYMCVCVSHLVVSDSLPLHGL